MGSKISALWERRPRGFGRWLRRPTVRYVFGPVVLGLAAVAPGAWKLMPLAVGGLLVEGSQFATAADARRKEAEIDLRDFMDFALGLLEKHYPEPREASFRANVMLIGPDDCLRIQYTSGTYRDDEKQLGWRKGEGTAGCAWENARMQVAPDDAQPLPQIEQANDRDPPWRMTREQIHATAGRVEWVISVPISLASDPLGSVIGVFNVDDSEPPRPENKDTLPDEVAEIAVAVAKKLEKLNLHTQ